MIKLESSMRIFKFIVISIFIYFSVVTNAAQTNLKPADLINAMQSNGHILMLRHSIAPGFGDPDNIQIGDCSTQRNLDESGRNQSKNIGAWLKLNNIKPSAIYSSQWCRCLDTARLLNIGEVEELPSLNSFFQMTENREPNLNHLKQFISIQKPNKSLIIMVTHSVTISAISGQSVASGDGVLLKLNNNSHYEFVSVVRPKLDQ